MSGQNESSTSPGEIAKLEFPVTVSVLLLIAVLGLTAGFIWLPTWRLQIEFFGIAAGVAAGILSAYYVGQGLKITIEQRDKAAIDERISRAFGLASRWNEPNFAKLREDWRALLKEIDGQTEAEICRILDGDLHKTTVTVDVLNFFEEVAYATRTGVADIDTLRNIHHSIVVHYFTTISPWIDKRRRDKKQQTAFEHLEWLANQWK
ncbi:MAG: DUF4760 domain-containing protein [Candidatus Acidiferrales bacterium]